MAKTPTPRLVVATAPCTLVVALVLAAVLLLPLALAASLGDSSGSASVRGDRDPEDMAVARRPIPVALRRLVWSDFLYPAKDPESPLNFELDPFNATAELTASQQDDIIYAAQHPTPQPTEESAWKKFWHVFF